MGIPKPTAMGEIHLKFKRLDYFYHSIKHSEKIFWSMDFSFAFKGVG